MARLGGILAAGCLAACGNTVVEGHLRTTSAGSSGAATTAVGATSAGSDNSSGSAPASATSGAAGPGASIATGSSGASAASGRSGSSGGTGSNGGAAANAGYVWLIQTATNLSTSDPSQIIDNDLMANIFPGPASTLGACYGQLVGQCCYTAPVTTTTGSTTGGVTYVGAGPIAIVDNTQNMNLATLTFMSGGGYSSVFTYPTPDWSGGDSISISAPGDTVGPFAATLFAPNPLTGLNPPYDGVVNAPVPTGSDLVVTWPPGTSDTIELEFSAPGGLIVCDAPDSAGTLTVPGSLLGNLSGTGGISVSRIEAQRLTPTNGIMDISARYEISVSGTFGGGCGPSGWPCQSDGICCSESCGGASGCACEPTGSPCQGTWDCCNGMCAGEVCACIAVDTYECQTDADCCTPAICYLGGSAKTCANCGMSGQSCAVDHDCCSGLTCQGEVCG